MLPAVLEAMTVQPMEAETAPTGLSEPSSGRATLAYEMLHEAIREGTLEPGRRLMEVEISSWLRMSRTPVREAMRRLQAEGMLAPAAGGGVAVMIYDLRAIGEFYATRETLEGTAAALAARHADETELRVLAARLEAMCALPPEPRLHARENQAFHEQIYQAARNRFLLKSLKSLLNFVPLLGPTTYNAPRRMKQALAEHADIIKEISNRRPDHAEEAMRQHIRNAHESRIHIVSSNLYKRVEKEA